jgi:hypothetical protein
LVVAPFFFQLGAQEGELIFTKIAKVNAGLGIK